MRARHGGAIVVFIFTVIFGICRFDHRRIAAVAISAAQHHARIGMHGVAVSRGVAGNAAERFFIRIHYRLTRRCSWCCRVGAGDGLQV